jgi:hypothetical protein
MTDKSNANKANLAKRFFPYRAMSENFAFAGNAISRTLNFAIFD